MKPVTVVGLAALVVLGACSSDSSKSAQPKGPSEVSTQLGTPEPATPTEQAPAGEALPSSPADSSAATSPAGAPTPLGGSAPSVAGAAKPQPNTAKASGSNSGSAAQSGGSGGAGAPSKAGAPAAPAPTPAGAKLAPAPSGGGGATDVGVTDSEIKVGAIWMHGMQLGELLTKPMDETTSAQIRLINDQGGINGRKFKYLTCDDGVPDAARTKACYKKLVEQDKIFAFLSGLTFNSGLIQAAIQQDKIPAIAPDSLYRSQWDNPWSFPIHMGMEHEAHAAAQWTAEIIKPKTVGLICLNNAEMQATCDAATAVLGKNGIKVVHRVNTKVEQADMSGDVLAMRAANPDFMLHYTTHPAATARFMLNAQQQDYWPPKGMAGNHMAAEFLGELIGNYPAKKGYWTQTTYKLWGPDLVAWTRKYAPGVQGMHNHVQQGQWWSTNVFFDVLKKMGPNVTRQGLKQQLETGEYTTGPGLDQKIMWAPQGRNTRGTAARREFMYKAVDQDWYASKDGAAAPHGLVPDPGKFVIEDTAD